MRKPLFLSVILMFLVLLTSCCTLFTQKMESYKGGSFSELDGLSYPVLTQWKKNPESGSYLTLFDVEKLTPKFIPMPETNAFFYYTKYYKGKYYFMDFKKSTLYITESKTGNIKKIKLEYSGVMSSITKNGKLYIFSNVRFDKKMPIIVIDTNKDEFVKEIYAENFPGMSQPYPCSFDNDDNYIYFSYYDPPFSKSRILRINFQEDKIEDFMALDICSYLSINGTTDNKNFYFFHTTKTISDKSELEKYPLYAKNHIQVIDQDTKELKKVIYLPSSEMLFGKTLKDENWIVTHMVSKDKYLYMNLFADPKNEKNEYEYIHTTIKYNTETDLTTIIARDIPAYEMKIVNNKLVLLSSRGAADGYKITMIDLKDDKVIIKDFEISTHD